VHLVTNRNAPRHISVPAVECTIVDIPVFLSHKMEAHEKNTSILVVQQMLGQRALGVAEGCHLQTLTSRGISPWNK
jgi:hypothetical protein